jgi:hypothetical protein
MTVQAVSVTVPGAAIRAYALDLIHDVLVLRLEGASPVQRGDEVPAAVAMPGASAVPGVIIGLEGLIVRFEPRRAPQDLAITPQAKLAPIGAVSRTEVVTADVNAAPRARAAHSTFGQRRSAAAPVAAPAAPVAPAAPAVVADVLRIATGRSEVPQTAVVSDLTQTAVTLLGFAAREGQRLAVTLRPAGRPPLRLAATVTAATGPGVTAEFSFQRPTDQLQLLDVLSALRG